jgi:lysozyme
MTRIYGFRPLHEEDDATRYKREGWDPRKTYEENMSGESLFVDDGSLEEPDLAPAPRRRKPSRHVQQLAAQGRGEDTEVAHVTRGELVVPQALQTPEFMAALARAAEAYGVPLERLRIGSAMNRINPETGAPEFWFDGLTPEMNSFAERFANTRINIDPTNSQMSDYGRQLLKLRETGDGKPSEPYYDIAGNLTSGYGHKGLITGSPEEAFTKKVSESDSAVNRNIKVPLTQAEHDALSSKAYNIGQGAFRNSSFPNLINSGDFEGAADLFLQYNKAKNPETGRLEFSRGIANRSQQERDQFLAHTLFVRGRRLP